MSLPDAQHEVSVGVVLSSVSRNAGGVFDAVRQACAAILEDTTVQVQVHGVRDDRTDADIADWAPVPVRAFDPVGPSALAHAPGMYEALKANHSFDVLHQHGIWQSPSRAVLAWRKRGGGAVIISPHGMLDPWAVSLSRRKKQIAAALFETSNLRGAACLHALNEAERKAIRAYGLTNPIATIANGVSLPNQSGEAAKKLDEDGRRTLLFLGRLHPKKGLSELFEAWAILKADDPSIAAQWKIRAVGWDDGGHYEALQQQVVELGLSDDVSLPGPLFGAEKDKAFRDASGFILASHSEGLPMAILEAWAWRLPVFMTSACNLPVGFEKQAACEITTEPAAIAQVLKVQLSRQDLQSMGENGYALARNQFTWTAIGNQFRTLYRWIASGADRSEAPVFVSF